MVEPISTDNHNNETKNENYQPNNNDLGLPNPEDIKPKSKIHKKWIILSVVIGISVIAGLIVGWPYKSWLVSSVGCGAIPVIGISVQANGDFGSSGKVAVLPDDPNYSKDITYNTFWQPSQVSYYCNEQIAASNGYLTLAAYEKAHPEPSFNMETPVYGIQALLTQGYAPDSTRERISYDYTDTDAPAKYPYYTADYVKQISSDKIDAYMLREYKITKDDAATCDTSLFNPYEEAVAPEIGGKEWKSCSQVATSTQGFPIYLGIVGGGYDYSVYFAKVNGTLVVIMKGPNFTPIPNITELFNSLTDYSTDKVPHQAVSQPGRPIQLQ